MAETIYATFPDTSLAERAAGALLDYGVRAEDLSLVSKEVPADYTRRDEAAHTATLEERRTPTGDTTDWTANRTGQAGNRMAEASDQTAADAAGAVGADRAAAGYQAAADERARYADAERANADANAGYVAGAGRRSDVDYRTDEATRSTDDRDRDDLSAKTGLSTTTPADAGAGAAKGAAIGLGVGILAAIASLIVPGFGLVAGGGALATAIAGAAGATVGGGVAGGVFGYLKDQGMPEHAAAAYEQAYQQGGAIMAIQAPSGDVDRATIENILGKYGAANVGTYTGRMAA